VRSLLGPGFRVSGYRAGVSGVAEVLLVRYRSIFSAYRSDRVATAEVRRDNYVQTYETVITSWDNEWQLTFLVIPRRSISASAAYRGEQVEITPEIVKSGLEAKDIPFGGTPTDSRHWVENSVISPLALMLIMQENGLGIGEILRRGDTLLELSPEGWNSLEFVRGVIENSEIPFEQSPLEGKTIESLITKAGSAGGAIGAYVGWIMAGNSPWLLITVPAGMILCGAASGVASGLNQGLKEKISHWLFPGLVRTDVPQPSAGEHGRKRKRTLKLKGRRK
jgi:hypothetical protein